MEERRSVALVVEGGGMRGAYAAGAVVEVLDRLGDQIGGIFATSSGASTAAYVASNQREGLDIWKDHLHGRRLVHPARVLWGGTPLDVDYLIDVVFAQHVPLDLEAVRRFPGPFEVTLTRADDGTAAHVDLRRADILPTLKAAVSLPGAVRRPVALDGVPFVDGGLVDPIPVRLALEAGFKDVVAVLTRPQGYRKRPAGRVATWMVTRDFPALADAVARQHERYNEASELLDAPPEGVRLTQIRPDAGVGLSRWTTSRPRLLAGIEAGAREAKAALVARGR